MLRNGKNLGFNEDAPGADFNFFLFTDRLGIDLSAYYSTSHKVKTGEGHTDGAEAKILYRPTGKLFLCGGVKYRYYDAKLWQKEAYFWLLGARYGYPDVLSLAINHCFKENSIKIRAPELLSSNILGITSIELTGSLTRGKIVRVRMNWAFRFVRYEQHIDEEWIPKTGIGADVGIGFLFNFSRTTKEDMNLGC